MLVNTLPTRWGIQQPLCSWKMGPFRMCSPFSDIAALPQVRFTPRALKKSSDWASRRSLSWTTLFRASFQLRLNTWNKISLSVGGGQITRIANDNRKIVQKCGTISRLYQINNPVRGGQITKNANGVTGLYKIVVRLQNRTKMGASYSYILIKRRYHTSAPLLPALFLRHCWFYPPSFQGAVGLLLLS